MRGTFWSSTLPSLPPAILWPQFKQQEGNTALLSTENWIKIYWAWPHPSEQDPGSPSVSLSYLEASMTLFHDPPPWPSIRGQPEWKPQSEKMKQTDQWKYEPCLVEPHKMDGSWWRLLTKCAPLERGLTNDFSILALKTPWTVGKGKKIGLKDELPRSVGIQNAMRDQSRNNSRKNEEMEPKHKQYPVVDLMGDGS